MVKSTSKKTKKLKPRLVMCVGFTHSGKTSLGNKLKKCCPLIIRIDTDEIATFVKKSYPSLVLSAFNKKKRTFVDPNIKFVLFESVLVFALRSRLPVVLTNGNLGKDIRRLIRRLARAHGYNLVTVYFNVAKKEIFERIERSSKKTDILVHARSWDEAFRRQLRYAELPPEKSSGPYFEITGKKDADSVLRKLALLLS